MVAEEVVAATAAVEVFPQLSGCHVYQQLEVLKEVHSYDIEVNCCQQEVPGVTAATESDGVPSFSPARNFLPIGRLEEGASGW